MVNSKQRRTNNRKRLAIRRTKKKNSMTEAKRLENEADILAGIDAQAARNIVIINEEFAKNATPDVTKAAILARLAKRDVAFRASVVAEFGEEDVEDTELVGNLDL